MDVLARLRSQVRYDASTGDFVWLVSKRGPRRAGDLAGSIGPKGYWRVCVDGKTYIAHRLAWLLHYGTEPQLEIDHIDGDRLNNRIANLRLATRVENCRNKPAAGIRFEADRGRWLARICVNRKQINLGRFASEQDARAAYEAAVKEYFGEFSRVG